MDRSQLIIYSVTKCNVLMMVILGHIFFLKTQRKTTYRPFKINDIGAAVYNENKGGEG